MSKHTSQLPWEICGAFTRDRLILLGQMLLAIRAQAVKAMLPIKGDNAIVRGTRVYHWTREQLADEAAKAGLSGWLYAKPLPQMKFDLRIGNQPIHYFRGDVEHPSDRSIESGLNKMQAEPELFAIPDAEITEVARRWMPCIVVETDAEGYGTAVKFCEVSYDRDDESGEFQVRNVWDIPVREKVAGKTSNAVLSLIRGGRHLARPKVTPKRKPRRKSGSDDERSS